ncbi:hypothetical protein [uncultured Dialister sp.]
MPGRLVRLRHFPSDVSTCHSCRRLLSLPSS